MHWAKALQLQRALLLLQLSCSFCLQRPAVGMVFSLEEFVACFVCQIYYIELLRQHAHMTLLLQHCCAAAPVSEDAQQAHLATDVSQRFCTC